MILRSNTIVEIQKACLQKLHHEEWEQGLQVDILRIDKIHPVISGNKWFKLKYYLEELRNGNKKGIITFGGAWSNHVHAVAHICRLLEIQSVAIIRGERPATPSITLQEAEQNGMQLLFLSREEYKDLPNLYKKLLEEYDDLQLVPEGGFGEQGIQGAEEITALVDLKEYSHVVCAVATGTMAAGLIRRLFPGQQLVGVAVLKIADKIQNSINSILASQRTNGRYQLFYDYHFGGYAKYNQELLQFMNETYQTYLLPTDMVYTGKLLFGFTDLIKKKFFNQSDKILIIHSGGLQGNRSLLPGMLDF